MWIPTKQKAKAKISIFSVIGHSFLLPIGTTIQCKRGLLLEEQVTGEWRGFCLRIRRIFSSGFFLKNPVWPGKISCHIYFDSLWMCLWPRSTWTTHLFSGVAAVAVAVAVATSQRDDATHCSLLMQLCLGKHMCSMELTSAWLRQKGKGCRPVESACANSVLWLVLRI